MGHHIVVGCHTHEGRRPWQDRAATSAGCSMKLSKTIQWLSTLKPEPYTLNPKPYRLILPVPLVPPGADTTVGRGQELTGKQ